MPSQPISTNLARIVHRLLTQHRGWRVDRLMSELDIADRTYRKYRKTLQAVPEFQKPDGSSMIQEVEDGPFRYLRLVEVTPHEAPWNPDDFTGRVAALHFSQQLLTFLGETNVATAVEDLIRDFEHGLRDRPFVLRHVLRNVDRIFFHLPDAPKDYSAKNEIIAKLLKAMIYTHPIHVTYSSASFDEVQLELEPFSLAVHRSALYLIARSTKHGDVRIYAVDRIRSLEVQSTKFQYPSRQVYDPAEYTEGSFGIFRSDSDVRIEFELVFANERWLKLYITERRWHPTQSFEELDDGRLRMRFSVNTDVEVWPWIRQFGDQVEVLKPGGR